MSCSAAHIGIFSITFLVLIFTAPTSANALTSLINLIWGDDHPLHQRRSKMDIIRHHSFFPPLLGSSLEMDLLFWNAMGDAVVTDHYIRLTPSEPGRSGGVWNQREIKNMKSWEVTIGLSVTSKLAIGADGFVFWFISEKPTTMGSFFGHPGKFKGLAVVFDSYDNDAMRDNPAIHVLTSDGIEDGLEVFRHQDDFKGQTRGSCVWDYRNAVKPEVVVARIRYHADSLEIHMGRSKARDEALCVRVQNIFLPSDGFIGLTAETGSVTDRHDIHFVHFSPVREASYEQDVYAGVEGGDMEYVDIDGSGHPNESPEAVAARKYDHEHEAREKHYWREKTPQEKEQELREKEEQEKRERLVEEQLAKEAENEALRKKVAELEGLAQAGAPPVDP